MTQERRRIALLLEYDGTAFAGSQWQPNARTVQEVLEAALLEFTGEDTGDRVAFAGRTDSGVHASGQVAALTRALRKLWPATELTLHFHNTRGMGLANVIAAIDAGAERFDASLGGLGGCPYAPGATGNVCS